MTAQADLATRPATAPPGNHDVLVVGPNAAIDTYYELGELRPGHVNRITSVRDTAGGKANNLARALSRLGGRPLVVGIVAGRRGHYILDELGLEGIACDYVLAEGNSRLNTTLLEAGSRLTTVLLEPGQPVTAEALEALAGKAAAWMEHIHCVVLTGSLPPGGLPDYYARLTRQALAVGAQVAVDASGEPLRLAALAGPTIIKVNREEFESAFPGASRDWPGLLRQFHALADCGLKTLVLTDGAHGAVVLSEADQFWVRTLVASWVSPVGAGDTFLAGLLFGLGRGDSLRQAACLASAAAAANLQVLGCGDIDAAAAGSFLAHTRVDEAPAFMEAML
jgi:1-phosphofructokinase family hexose kinase